MPVHRGKQRWQKKVANVTESWKTSLLGTSKLLRKLNWKSLQFFFKLSFFAQLDKAIIIEPSWCEVLHKKLVFPRRYGWLCQTDHCAQKVGFLQIMDNAPLVNSTTFLLRSNQSAWILSVLLPVYGYQFYQSIIVTKYACCILLCITCGISVSSLYVLIVPACIAYFLSQFLTNSLYQISSHLPILGSLVVVKLANH